MSCLNDAQVYARQLLPKRHGYPLWVPEPYGNSVSYRTKGVRIGDVGHVTEDGAFETLFNVRASPSDPINGRGVPEGFEQVRIPLDDIVHIPNFHPPEGIVTSANTKKRMVDIEFSTTEIPGISPGVGSGVQFTWASSQGAILHLPTGACRLTCPPELFRDVAIRGAKNWYRFANETLRRNVPNGGLYLITGFDKTASWMAGAFSDKSSDSRVCFNLSALGCNAQVAYSYTWDTSCPAVFRIGPSLPIDSTDDLLRNSATIAEDDSLFAADAPNAKTQCVFVRGYRMMVRTSPVSLIRGGAGKIEVSSISSINSKDIAHPTMHRRYVEQSSATHLVRDSEASNDQDNHETSPADDSSFGMAFSEDLDAGSEETSLEYLPGETLPYHPSTSINELLLRLSPEAVVSLVHDDEWISVLHENDVEMLDDADLLSRVLEKYTCTKWGSAVYCVPRISRTLSWNPQVPIKEHPKKQPELRKTSNRDNKEQRTDRDKQIVAGNRVNPQVISNMRSEDCTDDQPLTNLNPMSCDPQAGHNKLFTEITNSSHPRNCLPRRRTKANGRPCTEPTKLFHSIEGRAYFIRRQKSLDSTLHDYGGHK